MKKTNFLVLLNWFKKTGKNIFRGVFNFAINFIARTQGYKDTRNKQITNPKLQITISKITNPPVSVNFSERADKLQITNYKLQFKKFLNFLTFKLSKLIKFCFSTKVRAIISSFLILTLLSSSFFFYKNYTPSKADYTNYVNQTDWSGGADTVSTITPETAEGWNKYYEKGANITADASGVVVAPSVGSATVDFTTDSDYIHEDDTKTEVSGGAGQLKDQFVCGTDTVSYEGQTYNTVLIGDQCWFKENLNVGTRVAGITETTNNSIIEKYCYNDIEANCTTYGGLYQWDEMMQYSEVAGAQGICPSGWHVPTDAEWYTLESGLATGTCSSTRSNSGDCDPAGNVLKVGGSSGFEGKYAGLRLTSGSFLNLDVSAYFWSSSIAGSDAWERFFYDNLAWRRSYYQPAGLSLRCLQNSTVVPVYPTTPSYLTTSDTSQKDTSTWSEISGITLTQTTPTNTDIKYLVSFDDRTTWKYFDGDSWETSTLDNLQTNGMSKTTLEGLTSEQWSSTGGFLAGTTATLDFAMDLSTTDNTVTPEIDNIEIDYGYYSVIEENIDFTTEGEYVQENSSNTDIVEGISKLSLSYEPFYPPEQGSTYVRATSSLSNLYYSNFATNPALSLIDGWNYNNWLSSSGNSQRFHIDLGSAQNINRIYYENSHHIGGYVNTGAKNFTFWGSNESTAFNDTTYNNDTNWTQITGLSQSQFDIHVSANISDPKYIEISGNEALYRYYAIKIADDWGEPAYLGFRHIELQGELYSTTPSYLTTSDTSQKNTSTWADINGITLTQTTPTNTDIKYLVSFDDRTTWKYFDGDSWETSTLDNLQTNGMSKTTLEGLTSEQWSSTGGFLAGTTATLDFAMDLSTTDSSVTPELDNIAIEYSQGLISSKFNSESTKNSMGGITWDEDATLPANSQVSLSLRTSSSEAGLDSQPWSIIGVSTPSSLTTGCTKSGTTVTCDATTIPSSMKIGGDDQWFQYKLTLVVGESSPTITNINPIYLQDIEAPIITSITSTTPNGEYKQGDSINLTVNFSEDVISTTGLTLTLNAGGTAVIPAWSTPVSSVSGTYTVGSTPTSALSVSSVAGTISDQPGNSLITGNLENIDFATEGEYVQEDADNGTDFLVGLIKLHENYSFSQTEDQKIIASDKEASDNFGYSVSIDGDTAVVGSWTEDPSGLANAGSAYIFTRSGTTWTEQQKITASDKEVSDYFGISVAISGDTVIVGAQSEDPSGLSNAGSAYIFTRSGTTWTEQQKITASDKEASDNFGYSVDVNGDTAIVGSYFEDPSSISDAGSAYIFTRSGTTWTEQQKITASDKGSSDYFGDSVAISGDTAIIGAYSEDPSGISDAGSAYIFTRSGTIWTEQQKITASDKGSSDYFGWSVDIDGETLVIGARAEDPSSLSDAGSAYIFTRSGTTWTEQQKINASDKEAGDLFGHFVSISGEIVAVGAFREDPSSISNAGSAYIFTRSGTTWTQQQKINTSDKETNDYFGSSVAVSEGTVIIGAYTEDPSGVSDAGSVYIYTADIYYPTTPSYITTSDASQIDLTGVKTIDSATISSTEPTNTSIKGLVSFDGRETWKKWGGDSWENFDGVEGEIGNFFVDGEDVIEDETGTHMISVSGNTAVSENQKQIGNSSILFNRIDGGYGYGDYLTIPNHTDFVFDSNNFTIDFWMRTSLSGNHQRLVSKYNATNASGWLSTIDSNNKINFIDSNGVNLLSSSTVSPNVWYHVAVVRNGNIWTLYINGNSVASTTDLDSSTNAAVDLIIGRVGTTMAYDFNGYLDNVRIVKGQALWTENFDVGADLQYSSSSFDFIQNGNTMAEIEAGLTGLSITDQTSLDFAMDLSTTDSSVTPELDNIEIEYTSFDSDYANSSVNPTITSNLEATSTILIDNTAPTSTISVPNGIQTEYSNMAEISGTASDNNTLETIYVSIKDINANLYWDGDSWEALQTWLPNTTGTTAWTYDSSGVVWDVNTEYLIESKAEDEAGNQETPGEGKTFTFVNSAPIVSNVSASKTSTSVEVGYDVTDDGSAETTISLVYDSGSTLQTEMNNTTTSNIEVSDISIFPSTGTILMQSGTGEETRYEYLSYTGISGNFLTGITRATQSTLGYAHTIGTTIYLKAETTTGDSGLVTNGTTKSLIWNVASDNNFYDTAQIVGVVSHDGASANQVGLGLSESFILDSTTPSIDIAPTINALTVPAQLAWTVSDDTALQMMISLNSDFSGASWEPYSANSTIALATNPDTVYIKFQDSQNNTTTDQILTTPNSPESLMIQDVSSIDQAKWRLYTSWQIVSTPTPGFEAYRIYRSATQDGIYTYQGSTASGDINVDYFADTVNENDEYYYKIATEDTDGNISFYSGFVWGIANATLDAGEGGGGAGGDTTPPTITVGPTVTGTTSNSATITWETNEESDSFIEYGTTTGYGKVFGNSTTGTSHSVLLENLSGSTTYHYRVRTRDLAGNLTTSSDATFTTSEGEDATAPIILSGPTVSSLTSSSAVISWTTDENSNSLVDFGTTTNIYTGTQGNGEESTTTHSILLNNLTPGETYYFKVRSLDSNNNQVISEEAEFTTISSPTISAVTHANLTDDSTIITFTTSTNSYGYIDYGTTTNTYTETKGELISTTSHSINLTNLTSGTEYFYKIRLKDIYGNYTLDNTEYSFTTNSGDTPTLNSFTSTTEDGSYNQGDPINITATYSEAIASGSITIKLNTEAELELTGTGTTLTGTYTIQSGENTTDLAVSEIQVQNVCDADNNCLNSITLPATNINTNSTIIVDTTNPTITGFSPNTSSTVATDNFSYTLSEAIASGTLTVTRTGGTADGNSPHTYNLTGTDLTTGAHSNLDPGMTLVNGAIYTFSLTVTDPASNTDTETTTGVTYDTDSMTLTSFSSTSSSDTYGPTETINITATYSKEIASGELTVTLDTGAEVTLNTISANTISGVYIVGSTGSGEDSTDLSVSSIDSETICDSVNNCPNSALPATNINTNSTIIIDTTAPVFTVSSPTNNSTINNLTTTSNLSYQIDENLTVGTITISLVSGTDDNAPHTCTLIGTNLNAGTYTNFDTTNCQEGEITLTNESVYNFEFSGTDGVGNSGTTQRTGIVFNPSASVITISAVSSGTPTSTSTTITFTTNENSYGYIDYGTTDSYGKVQGNNVTPTTSHSIEINGLTANTTYHFRPRVKSLAGDYTLGDDAIFLTAEDPEEPSEEGPEISNVRVDADSLGYNQATVMWETDEEANSAVTYGETVEYGKSHGNLFSSTVAHSVTLPDLNPETQYYFKVSSRNTEGNETTDDNSSSGYTFSTLSGSQGDQISNVALEIEDMINNLTYTEEEIMEAISNISSNEITSSGPKESLENNIDVTISWTTNKNSKGKVVYKQVDQDNYTTLEELITTTTGYTKDHEIIIKNLNPQTDYEYYVVSTSILGNQVSSDINNFTTGETPKISNVMVNNTSLNEATISWTTNSIKTSILEYGTSTKYGTEKEEASSTNETNQTVLLTNLEAGQEYHFRIKGIDEDEETTTTNDYTFITAALPVISNINISDIGIETVTITWETNSPTDSLIEYAFQGEEQGTSQGVLEATTDHTIVLEKLIPGVNYQATIYSKDQFGNQASSELITFTTLEDNNPPSIQNISSDTTMYPGEELKIQTVISWVTSKDSYSAIAFRKGVSQSDSGMEEKLQELVKQETEDNFQTTYNEWTLIKKPVLTKNHLFILTDFEPSSVYQYKVISVDKRGNSVISKDYSFLTPSKRESIFDLIIANLEETFGWVRNVR